MLPEDWKEISLEKISRKSISYGIVQTGDSKLGTISCVRVVDLTKKELSIDDMIKTTEEINQSYKRTILEKGEIIFALRGEIGVVKVVDETLEGINITRGVARVSPTKDVLPYFLIWALRSPYYATECMRRVGGSALQEISIGELRKSKILLPPLAEQKKIAEILSTWDEAISVVDRQLENCRQQKKALMQKLLTGKKRLPRFSGEWKAKRLSSFCKRITERNNGHCSLVATISAQYGLIRQEEFFNKSVASETLDNYFLLRKGDFAYNKSYSLGYPMGAIKRLNRYQEAVVTSLYICFRLDETKADSDYFEFFFDSGLLDKPLTQIAAEGGRAHGLLNVRPDDFMGIQILFPPLEEQKAIASVLSTSARQIEMLEQKLHALQDEKKSLMQQLLTGKKRVAVEE